MPDLTMKRHDTAPALTATLLSAGNPIDLTNATSVKIIMKGAATLVTGVCVIVTPASGAIAYHWAPGDLAVADTYQVEFEITWNDSTIETVPNASYNSILVVVDLENA